MPKCNKCKEIKSAIHFSKNKNRKNGLQIYCKNCSKEIRKAYKEITPNATATCSKCNVKKASSEFNRAAAKSGLSSYCKECCYNYQLNYNYIEGYRSRRKDRVNWLRDLKRKPCTDCNNLFDPALMDFDHLNNKVKSVSRMVLDNTPKNIILKEIDKCELVCALCHNKRTQKRLDERSSIKKYSNTARRNIEIINRYKDVPCNICENRYESFNMQFDHLIPSDKIKNVSQMKHSSVDDLLSEISKCQVLCVMCHRKKSLKL